MGAFYFMKFVSLILLLFVILFSVHASETHLGSNGVSGLTITPTTSIEPGIFRLQYMERNIGIARSDGFNYSSSFGLTEFLEIGGRLSANTWNRNLFTEDVSGVRDLSASGKLLLNPLFNFNNFPIKTALGVIDYGGAAALYRSNYFVAMYERENWQFNAGYAKSLVGGRYNPLSGNFGSLANQISPWLSVNAEFSGKKTWTGVTLSDETITKYLGASKGSNLYLNLTQQIAGENLNGKNPILSFGIKLPLDNSISPHSKDILLLKNSSANGENNNNKQNQVQSLSDDRNEFKSTAENKKLQTTDQLTSYNDQNKNEMLRELARKFGDQGFESIDIGIKDNTLIVQFSDFIYDHNILDGAGVALGLISQISQVSIKLGLKHYRMVLSKWGTPSVGYSGDLNCLKSWLDDLSCNQSAAAKPQVRYLQSWLDNVDWTILSFRSYKYKPRIKLNPVQNYYVGTEYSVVDYSLGTQMQVAFPLWKGGVLEYGEIFPIKDTKNYGDFQIFNYTKVRHQVEHTLFHQFQRLGGGFSARGTAGQLFTGQVKGIQGEIRWESESGQLESGMTTSYWKDQTGYLTQSIGRPTSGFVKYAPAGKDWTIEFQLGEYWYHDKGDSFLSNHWFGDTMLTLYLRRSVPPEAFWPGDLAANFAGFNISFPLTPRRGMKPDYFQVKGASQYGFSLGTPIGRKDNYIVGSNGIPIYIKALVDAPVMSFLATDVLDHDRANMSYLPYHMERIRYAYLKWVKVTGVE